VPAQLCPEDSNSAAGAAVLSDCLCDAGHSGADGGLCSACPAGQWKHERGITECSFCSENTHSEPRA